MICLTVTGLSRGPAQAQAPEDLSDGQITLAVENAFEGGARTVDNDLDVRFQYDMPQPGFHYEAPYWPDPWLNGMGLYW